MCLYTKFGWQIYRAQNFLIPIYIWFNCCAIDFGIKLMKCFGNGIYFLTECTL